MPQMSPMMWLYLLIYFISIYLIIMMMIYYMMILIKNSNKNINFYILKIFYKYKW